MKFKGFTFKIQTFRLGGQILIKFGMIILDQYVVYNVIILNMCMLPLTVFGGYIRPKTVVACIGYSASHSQNFEKPLPCF